MLAILEGQTVADHLDSQMAIGGEDSGHDEKVSGNSLERTRWMGTVGSVTIKKKTAKRNARQGSSC